MPVAVRSPPTAQLLEPMPSLIPTSMSSSVVTLAKRGRRAGAASAANGPSGGAAPFARAAVAVPSGIVPTSAVDDFACATMYGWSAGYGGKSSSTWARVRVLSRRARSTSWSRLPLRSQAITLVQVRVCSGFQGSILYPELVRPSTAYSRLTDELLG